jgi:isopenicillin-N N-acyltransferase like protein
VFEMPRAAPRERGRAHGEAFRPLIAEVAALRTELAVGWGFSDGAAVLEVARAHLPVLEAFSSSLHAELVGIAEGAALTPEEIVVLNHYTDLRDIGGGPPRVEEDCTAAWARTPAGAVLGQTWDTHGSARPYVCMLGVPSEGGEPAAWLLSIVGCVGMTGLNDVGVGVAINNLISTDAGVGVVWPAVVRRALRACTATEARDVILSAPLGSGHHYLVADRMAAFGIETSGRSRTVVFGGDRDAFVHTNHCLAGEVAAHSRVSPESTTHDRYQILEAGLRNAPLRDVHDLWERLGSHEAYPRAVCTHMATADRPHAMATCGAVAMDLDRGVLFAAQGCIHRARPQRFDFARASAGIPRPGLVEQAASATSQSEAGSHPFFFTWTAQRSVRPFALAGGEGAWCTEAGGARWLDLASLTYQANAGHGHRRIIEAVRAQASRLCLTSPAAVYPEKAALAEALLARAPAGFSKVLFTLGGAEAMENAIKVARLSTGRRLLVSRERSYHGATLGALSLSGDHRRAPVEPVLADVVRVDDFACARCPFGVRSPLCDHAPLTAIPRVLGERRGEVAAVFVESVVGANGVLIPPPGTMRELRQACDQHGALLVCDEVLTGFGRTGRWWRSSCTSGWRAILTKTCCTAGSPVTAIRLAWPPPSKRCGCIPTRAWWSARRPWPQCSPRAWMPSWRRHPRRGSAAPSAFSAAWSSTWKKRAGRG